VITLRRHWPSPGFWVFACSWIGVSALLVWGATEPDLVRAWRILEAMERPEFQQMSGRERRVLSRSLHRHPTLIEALSGDRIADFVEPTEQKWIAYRKAHLAVRPQPDAPIRIWTASRAHPAAYPLTVAFRSSWLDETLVFHQDERLSFDLPLGQPATPELVQVFVTPAEGVSDEGHPFEIHVEGEALTASRGEP
jgi:hypothetical protein